MCFFVECLPRLCLLTYQEDREEHPPVKMFLQHQSLKVFLEIFGAVLANSVKFEKCHKMVCFWSIESVKMC